MDVREEGRRAPRRSGTVRRKTIERARPRAGLCSRTAARALVRAGRVAVGGRTERDPERWVDPLRDALAVDGKPLAPRERLYLALNKPCGVVTSARDPDGRRTVYAFLGE